MNLRRKLLTTFGALVLLGLAIAGSTVWATVQWESSNQDLQDHYTRSLEVQRIRAATFRAFKETSDAIIEGDQNARQEFEEQIEEAEQDFEVWVSLADTEEERQQVQEVLDTYFVLVRDARQVFDLVEAGREEEAVEFMEEQLEGQDFQAFEAATGEAVTSDRSVRENLLTRAEEIQQTAQVVLLVASFGILSLILLVAAYLASDLFRPLREIGRALEDVEKGDLDRRLDEERADELGAVNRAFNRMVEAASRREKTEPVAMPDGEDGAWQSVPSRVTLHRLVSRLRSKIVQLGNGDRRELVEQIDRLSQAVVQITKFGFPLDLDLARTDVRALIYGLFMSYGDELAGRAVSVELEISPEVDHAVVDRLKLREALSELLRHALSMLPERGGRLGLRARIDEEQELVIELANDGMGDGQPLIDELFDPTEEAGGSRIGLALVQAIIEQHGGRLDMTSLPDEGACSRILLPLTD